MFYIIYELKYNWKRFLSHCCTSNIAIKYNRNVKNNNYGTNYVAFMS